MDLNKIKEQIQKENRLLKFLFMIIGVFLLALNYNLFFLRNELVVGGISGLAIVFNRLFGWNNQIIIYIGTLILLIVSCILFGYKKTRPAIIGGILYPFMVTFTAPLAELLAPYFVFEDLITTVILTSVVHGLASGIIYKMGYNTGGADIIVEIMKKYLHIQDGTAIFFCNVTIILFGGLVLGVTKVIYAIVILFISSTIVDKILIGISKSKLFIISTNKEAEVREAIMDQLGLGLTVLVAQGGYSNSSRNLLMCVVPTKDYYLFKGIILAIDPKAFFIINDCYDTYGGTINSYGLDRL